MRLPDFAKTSAFRLTLLFSALMIGSVLLLFGFVYWQTTVFLGERFDESLIGEGKEILDTPPEGRSLAIDNLIASDPARDWHVGLFGANGKALFGNIEEWPQAVVPDGKSHSLHHHHLRAVGLTFPDGDRLVVARRADEIHEISDLIERSLIAGLAGSLGLALLGGLVMSFASLRRIEAMHRAAARIMNGDLSQRLPEGSSGDDFDKLAGIVNAMLGEIERLIGDIKAAGDNIAHDLRTPLTRLRTRLEGSLRRGGTIGEHRAAMEDAIAETDQLLATFRALLRIGEVEAGARRAGFGEVDLVKLVTSAAELFEPLAAERGLAFSSAVEPAPAVRGDPDLLFEAVANLLDNAMKFTPAGGQVALSLAADGGIAVADSGPGLPPELKDALFQRFTRGDKARHLPGNGLGLSLVAAVARLHGFTLTMENTEPGCRAALIAKAG